jgi:outer membrane protein assembly factor BamA
VRFSRLPGIFILLFPAVAAMSQVVSLRINGSSPGDPVEKISYSKKHQHKQDAFQTINEVIISLQESGHLLASVDTITGDSVNVVATISSGKAYRFAFLRMGNLSPVVASKLGLSERLYFNKPFRYKELARSFEKIIVWYENNGHPFVTVKIDSLKVEGESISGCLNVQKNKFYKIDSVLIVGSARLNKKFLYRYLDVKPGAPYNEEAILAISSKIKQLPFLVEKKSSEARLTERINKLVLFIDKKDASQFDGIIGLLPDANTGKTVITGDVKLKVVNGILRNGETFDLEWRRLQSQTQDFNGRLIYPYIFGTPIGTDYSLKIYRRDTSFIDVNNNIGLQYYFSGLNNFKVFFRQKSSNLISTSGLKFVSTLPEYADISTTFYGLGFFREKLDYRFNPHKGSAFNLNAQIGDREIRRNYNINETAYEGLLLRSTQYQAEGQVSVFIQLYRNNVLKLGLQGATIFGNSVIFTNELFRIGGLKTLRGFDEESIFASSFVIPTIEYRFLFAENSNILLFMEGAWYENNSNHKYYSDTPLSFGAGINFQTRAGILGINYAIGNQAGNGFDARSGKIHFGLTALF